MVIFSGGERQRISIAHRMRTVAGADKIVVLEEGRVVEQGTPSELMKSGTAFRRMVELQQKTTSRSESVV